MPVPDHIEQEVQDDAGAQDVPDDAVVNIEDELPAGRRFIPFEPQMLSLPSSPLVYNQVRGFDDTAEGNFADSLDDLI